MTKRNIKNSLQVKEKEEVTLNLSFMIRKWPFLINRPKIMRSIVIKPNVRLSGKPKPDPNPSVYTNRERIGGRIK